MLVNGIREYVFVYVIFRAKLLSGKKIVQLSINGSFYTPHWIESGYQTNYADGGKTEFSFFTPLKHRLNLSSKNFHELFRSSVDMNTA